MNFFLGAMFWTLIMQSLLFAFKYVIGSLEDEFSKYLSREHFSRPGFRAWTTEDGRFQCSSGEDLSHSDRCVNWLRDSQSRSVFVSWLAGQFVAQLVFNTLFIGMISITIWLYT